MESMNKDVIKQVAGKKGVSAKDKMMEIYMADPGVNRSECAKVLGVVRQTINNWIKEFEKGKKK
jgi:DNA-binding XRE family transcriptional regulator